MDVDEIKQLFMEGIDCSQVVAGAFADELPMDEETLRKMTAGFGGGMMRGETCGAVVGALMVLGLRYGHSAENDADQKAVMQEKMAAFQQMFLEKYPSCMCKDLLGHDISKPGEMDQVMEEGLMFSFCPQVVADTIEIVRRLL